MKRTGTFLLALLASLATLAPMAAAQAPARTDVYHVHFAAAAPGQAGPLADFYKTPDKSNPMPGHFIVLRHQDGADWDYAVITHMGDKATVTATGNPAPANVRDATAWHTDTFVSGPSWPEFTRAMGIDKDAANTANSVYSVSIYRAVPGHRDQLEKALQGPGAPGAAPGGTVLLQHLEGGPWQYLAITRYNSWQDLGKGEAQSVADTRNNKGGWFDIREHASFHNDTFTDRIAP
jgi:hypothetical protein